MHNKFFNSFSPIFFSSFFIGPKHIKMDLGLRPNDGRKIYAEILFRHKYLLWFQVLCSGYLNAKVLSVTGQRGSWWGARETTAYFVHLLSLIPALLSTRTFCAGWWHPGCAWLIPGVKCPRTSYSFCSLNHEPVNEVNVPAVWTSGSSASQLNSSCFLLTSQFSRKEGKSSLPFPSLTCKSFQRNQTLPARFVSLIQAQGFPCSCWALLPSWLRWRKCCWNAAFSCPTGAVRHSCPFHGFRAPEGNMEICTGKSVSAMWGNPFVCRKNCENKWRFHVFQLAELHALVSWNEGMSGWFLILFFFSLFFLSPQACGKLWTEYFQHL